MNGGTSIYRGLVFQVTSRANGTSFPLSLHVSIFVLSESFTNRSRRPLLTIPTGASDATYHVMWVILFNAVDDFGIKEFNETGRMSASPNGPSTSSIESVKHKILDEALHGALRIAGLVCIIYALISSCSFILILKYDDHTLLLINRPACSPQMDT